jgi:hypothetical protein
MTFEFCNKYSQMPLEKNFKQKMMCVIYIFLLVCFFKDLLMMYCREWNVYIHRETRKEIGSKRE